MPEPHRAALVAAVAAASALVTGCDPSGATDTSSPAAATAQTLAMNLTFRGKLSATVTSAVASAPPQCGRNQLLGSPGFAGEGSPYQGDLSITVAGKPYELKVLISGYTGPKQYSVGSDASASAGVFLYPPVSPGSVTAPPGSGYQAYTGSVTVNSDEKSGTLDVQIGADGQASKPLADTHLTGSFTCAPGGSAPVSPSGANPP